jgi:hypothetical protein
MTRSEFLQVIGAGMSLGRLKGLQQHRLLPWPLPSTDNKWARLEYSSWRAALMVAFVELTAGGMPVELAAQALLQREVQIKAGPLVYKAGPEKGMYSASASPRDILPTNDISKDIWIGLPAIGDRVSLPPVFGTLREIAIDMAEGEPAFRLREDGAFGRLFLVNLTQAIRTVQARADKLGIELHW